MPIRRLAVRSLLSLAAMAAAFLAALAVLAVLHGLAPEGSLPGRSVVPLGLLTALGLVAAASWLALRRGYRVPELLLALVLAEVVLAVAIAALSGSTPDQRFFWTWFAGLGGWIAVPWLLAVLLVRRR
jgi:hypothetical protein